MIFDLINLFGVILFNDKEIGKNEFFLLLFFWLVI